MKKLFSTLIVSTMCFFAQAQVKVGILGGVNQSTIIESNPLPNWNSIKGNYKWLPGFHGGLFTQIPVNRRASLVFEPAVVYYNKGRKYFQQYDTLNTSLVKDSSFKEQLNYIDIPLNLLFKFSPGKKICFFIGGGPYFSFFFNGKQQSVTNYKDPSNYPSVRTSSADMPVGKAPGKYGTLDYGATVTAGVTSGKVFLRASASQSLTDIYQAPDYKGSFKNQVISISLGVTLATIALPEEKKKLPDTKIKAYKKIKDRDGDGIPDKEDACPNEPGPVATNGCPDRDGDGLPDKIDKCPDVKGPASNKGCPIPDIDTDGDGIPDSRDKCPTVKGLAKYNGCPLIDTDGDLIADDEDQCPTVAGLYRYHGCPIPDADGDGVNDEVDRCPLVPGLKSNFGCPLSDTANTKPTVAESSCYTAYFEFNVANLGSQAFNSLQQVVEKLKANNKLTVTVKGYTDVVGRDDANNKLSAERARVVAEYIASFYIDRKRINVSSYGKQNPVTDINDPAVQWKNRRVEVCIYEKK